jgi:pimeloyl-ACP methyl ester carboxylesterase
MRRSLPTFVAAWALAVFAGAPAAAVLGPGWTRLDLPAPASSYAWAYVPAAVGSGPAPAVVFLHGSGATPEHWRPFLPSIADALGVVVLLPKAGSDFGFGVGPDDAIVAETLRQASAGGLIDARRVGIAGHSAGGAYALELAYSTPSSFNGVFALASPYRTIVGLATPGEPPPLRLYYGSTDPNYRGSLPPLSQMLTRLGVEWELEVGEGHGHNDWPATTLRDGLRFLVQQPVPGCVATASALCLGGGRFRVEAAWQTGEAAGFAGAVQTTPESGTFWFFSPSNVELDVKVLEGCGVNARWWVFAAGLTNVRVVLTVTDTLTGASKSYTNPQGTAFQPIQDTNALAVCP